MPKDYKTGKKKPYKKLVKGKAKKVNKRRTIKTIKAGSGSDRTVVVNSGSGLSLSLKWYFN